MSAEAIGFAAKLGVNTKKAFDVLKSGQGSSWMFENRVPHLLERDERIYSALNIIVKDVVSRCLRCVGVTLMLLLGHCYCWWSSRAFPTVSVLCY